MSRKITSYLVGFAFLMLLVAQSCTPHTEDSNFQEQIKVALRFIGNELLDSNQDSTSLVLPVKMLSSTRYELSFEHSLTFDPTVLNKAVRETFEKANLPTEYLVEVINCDDGEVAYSYKMRNKQENSIIPCGGRLLSDQCYIIQFIFTNGDQIDNQTSLLFYLLVGMVLAFLAFVFYTRYITRDQGHHHDAGLRISSFFFYPDQNKLIKEAQEISLSKKECELLSILIENPNMVVKREELTKKVWEDNGVIVGRSLDTYISKLRKKLQDDDGIKITNIHGVGYKLELQ